MSSDPTGAALLDGLVKACGDEHVRPGGRTDAVEGLVPAYVAAPVSTDEVREVLLAARAANAAVITRGRGTKLGWGAPPRAVDLVIDLHRMAAVVEHAAGDLVTIVQPGVPLATLQEQLATADQQLALDEPRPGGTVGGAVLAGASGPRRWRYGTARDLVIGVTVVLADGTVAKAGGRVVKNVAGYDLGKLFVGSLGTLGVVTQLAFRLHPLPADRRIVTVDVDGPEQAWSAVRAVMGSQVVATAIELAWPRRQLAVLVEGVPVGVAAQAETLERLLGATAAVADEPPLWFGAWPFAAGEWGVKITFVPSGLPDVLVALDDAGATDVTGQAATGVLYAALPGPAGLAALRVAAGRHDGSVVVADAPPGRKQEVDVWGPVPGVELMRRVKEQFDPEARLAPGRFVGGM